MNGQLAPVVDPLPLIRANVDEAAENILEVVLFAQNFLVTDDYFVDNFVGKQRVFGFKAQIEEKVDIFLHELVTKLDENPRNLLLQVTHYVRLVQTLEIAVHQQ